MNFPNIFRLAAIYTWAPALKHLIFRYGNIKSLNRSHVLVVMLVASAEFKRTNTNGHICTTVFAFIYDDIKSKVEKSAI